MKFVLLTLACSALLANAFTLTAGAADAPPAKDQATLEREFAAMLTGVTLVGSYTASDSPDIKQDRYEIIKAVKGDGDKWTITAKIEYKGFAVPANISVPVMWAGD